MKPQIAKLFTTYRHKLDLMRQTELVLALLRTQMLPQQPSCPDPAPNPNPNPEAVDPNERWQDVYVIKSGYQKGNWMRESWLFTPDRGYIAALLKIWSD